MVPLQKVAAHAMEKGIVQDFVLCSGNAMAAVIAEGSWAKVKTVHMVNTSTWKIHRLVVASIRL